MATRNRTAAFLKYREAVKQSRPFMAASGAASAVELVDLKDASALLPGTSRSDGYKSISTTDADSFRGAPGGVAQTLPPAWVDISDEVAAEMARVRTKMAELAKAHARALMPSFLDGKTPQEHTIEVLTQEITRMLKRCEQLLQRLSRGSDLKEDSSIRKNVQRSMATDLQALSMEFRKQQKTYLQKLRRQQEGPSSGGLLDIPPAKSAMDDGLAENGFSDRQLEKLKETEAISQEREAEIIQILGSVNDLGQIMRDLSILVIDQGTIVDRIDYNVQNVAATVEKGLKQLKKAESTQKKGRMVVCIMFLAVLCLIMLVVLTIKKLIFG
eukprot:SM000025S08345  [mRNA]  locus=s25:128329:130579:- [translate_table: standard]